MNQSELQSILDSRFGGVLKLGKHREDGEACALELLSAVRADDWTDNPEVVRCFDLRPLNDIPVRWIGQWNANVR